MQANLESLSIITDFPAQIENIVRTKRVSYMDAVEIWCDDNGKEITTGAEYVKKAPVIKEKIREEAENLNLLSKKAH